MTGKTGNPGRTKKGPKEVIYASCGELVALKGEVLTLMKAAEILGLKVLANDLNYFAGALENIRDDIWDACFALDNPQAFGRTTTQTGASRRVTTTTAQPEEPPLKTPTIMHGMEVLREAKQASPQQQGGAADPKGEDGGAARPDLPEAGPATATNGQASVPA